MVEDEVGLSRGTCTALKNTAISQNFKNMYKTAAVLWDLVNLKLFVDACMYKILLKYLLK